MPEVSQVRTGHPCTTHNAPFILVEGMKHSHPNTKQKLDSLQEKLSVCQSLHHCTVITSFEV